MKNHHGAQAPNGPSQRQLRVGELVRHALAEILMRGEIIDPVIERHVITVTEVRMSPDLKHASCYVEPLGGTDAEAVAAALNKHARFLRGLVGKRMTQKFTPDLRFFLDTRFDDDSRIDTLLHSPDVARDLDRDD
ncbi:MAG: 30S ribosome-binding factor RbfA [Hyphomicrobiales bacterium]|nr:MAG: 30S ribosome-binding factor RbfA [Hyphomicrobiales bacterium]